MAGEAIEKLVRTIHTLYQDIELAKGEARRFDDFRGALLRRDVERSADALDLATARLWDPLAEAELAAEAALREIRRMAALMGR